MTTNARWARIKRFLDREASDIVVGTCLLLVLGAFGMLMVLRASMMTEAMASVLLGQ